MIKYRVVNFNNVLILETDKLNKAISQAKYSSRIVPCQIQEYLDNKFIKILDTFNYGRKE
jgi:hypothetical protein